MVEGEFNQWLEHHIEAYPGLAPWLEENESQTNFWMRTLISVEFEEAVAATDELYAAEKQPMGYSAHPRAILAIVRRNRGSKEPDVKYVDGERVFKCWRCEDSGYVSVLSPNTLKRLWKDKPNEGLRGCAVLCNCETGNLRAQMRWKEGRQPPQWKDGHCLLTFLQVYSVAAAKQISDWQAAHLLLMSHHEKRGTNDQH